MHIFLEGIDAVRLPCTLAVLVPAVALVLAAGRRAGIALVGFVLAAAVVAWARFGGRWFDDPGTLTSLGLGVVSAALFIGLWWNTGDERGARIDQAQLAAGAGLVVGATTAWLWQPCVGPRLGAIINGAPDDGLTALPPTLAYLAGATIVATALTLAPVALPRATVVRDHPITSRIGAGLGVAIGLTIAISRYDDIVAELLRHSSI